MQFTTKNFAIILLSIKLVKIIGLNDSEIGEILKYCL